MKLSNRWYDALKWIALILLPALAAFYVGLAQFWNLPFVEAISGSIMLLDAFLGALLGISTSNYTKELTVDK